MTKKIAIVLLLIVLVSATATTALADSFDLPEINIGTSSKLTTKAAESTTEIAPSSEPSTQKEPATGADNAENQTVSSNETTAATKATTKAAKISASSCKVSLSKSSYVYDGKAKKPAVTVKDGNGKTVSSGSYTVTYPAGRKDVGQYTVKITFKGNYTGTASKSFKIVPKATSLSKLKAASKSFKATWKKQTKQTTGYQIQYSTDKNFKKNNKTITISKNKTTSKTVKKLKAKKKYYVRIRTYKTVSKKNYYSSWSSSKAVTTKK